MLAPSSGTIKIAGQALSPNNLGDWQNNISYLPQKTFVADNSILKNVALGFNDSEIDHDRVKEVLKLAQLDRWVDSLPNKYMTHLGESGAAMSGGQRQRLGVARLLYSPKPLVLLDEATSALHQTMEKNLIEMFFQQLSNSTLLVVSHSTQINDLFDREINISREQKDAS